MYHDEKEALVKAAVLYYVDDKTQSEIARQLYISRPTVSRMLKRARERGVVNIRINYATNQIIDLEAKFKASYSLKDVIVVKTMSDKKLTLQEVGKAASDVLYDKIHDGVSIGISRGRAMRVTVENLREKHVERFEIVDLFGSIDFALDDNNSHSIGYLLSHKARGKFFPIAAPLYVQSAEIKESLVNSQVLSTSMKKMEDLEYLMTGLGCVKSSEFVHTWSGFLSKMQMQDLLDDGAVGSICARFFNSEGEFLDNSINKQVIGIELDLIKTKKIICVVTGLNKVIALKAALKANLINTLVTDEETAKAVLGEDHYADLT